MIDQWRASVLLEAAKQALEALEHVQTFDPHYRDTKEIAKRTSNLRRAIHFVEPSPDHLRERD